MAFRPALRPGAALLRRDATHLQIGTAPGIVVTDRPGLLALLRLLDGARDVQRLEALVASSIPELDCDVGAVLTELRSIGAVLDASRWSGPGRRGLDAEARHLDLGGGDPSKLAGRTRFALAFHADAASAQVIEPARVVLTQSGVTDLDSAEPDLLVIATVGESARPVFESPVAEGLDHLPVVIDEDRVRIGPLVRPGHTPCVSCHDLHRAEWDSAWPALMPQFGRHTSAITPPALAAVTAHAAAVELAVEILTHAHQRAARSLGHALVVGPGHDDRALWPVAFHHRCVCDLLHAA